MNTWNILNWFRYETFIHLFEFKDFSTWGERDTISFYANFSIWTPARAAPPPQTTGLASASSENRPTSSKPKSQLLLFSNPQNPQRFWAWRHSRPRSYFYLGFLLWHFWLSHPPRARVNTCTQLTHALSERFSA